MLRLRKNLPSVESWRREALGIWDEDVLAGVIPNWANLTYVGAEKPGITSHLRWALAVSPVELGAQWASIGKAGRTADGFLHIEWVEHRKGTRWIVPTCVEHYNANGKVPLRVRVGAPEGAFIDELRAAGVEVEEVSGMDEAHATGLVLAAASESGDGTPPALRHLGQPSLDKAVQNAVLRTGADGAVKWDPRKSTIEITPLRAVTVALGGVDGAQAPVKQAPMFAVT
jgi:hypothetical protein